MVKVIPARIKNGQVILDSEPFLIQFAASSRSP
jgi:hypothetical protein